MDLIDLIQHLDPRVLTAVGIAIIAAIALLVARHSGRAARDPQRFYVTDQRRECFDRSGYRCEMSALGPLRCQRPAEHADHHYPWSKGGATSITNAVAACARHNTSKGPRMPTLWDTWFITRRRRRYFPSGTVTRPGHWYR